MPRSPASVTPPTPTAPTDRYLVGSVARALRLVGLVADAPDGMGLTEIADALGTSKSTAHALARTLVAGGYLRTVQPGPRYHPGMELVRLGDAAGRSVQLGRLCQPVLVDLSRLTGLTTRAAICDDGYPVFVERVDSQGVIRFHTPLGVRELPHTSAAGKAILAELPAEVTERIAAETGLPTRAPNTIRTLAALQAELDAVRGRGFAVDDEEDAPGVMCVAAAFHDHAGQVAGAVSATGISREIHARGLDVLGGEVVAAATRISGLLGGARRPA